jgi:hypothetical protein
MKKLVILILLVLVSSCFAWKKQVHFISLPIIEGAGIYTSVRCLIDSKSLSTQIPSSVNVGLLAANAGLGIATIFTSEKNYRIMRIVHRITGMGITAAGLWMSIAAANDKDVNNLTRNISYGYTILTTVPIIVFSF